MLTWSHGAAPSSSPYQTMDTSSVPCDGLLCLDFLDQVTYNLTTFNTSHMDTGGLDYPESARNWQVFLLFLIVLAGITGNVLVCIAVSIEKKLHNVTNYFLMSLAIADLFVSLIVMPCSIVNEFMGKLRTSKSFSMAYLSCFLLFFNSCNTNYK